MSINLFIFIIIIIIIFLLYRYLLIFIIVCLRSEGMYLSGRTIYSAYGNLLPHFYQQIYFFIFLYLMTNS